jgi:predicted transcriptional regulator
MQIKKKEPLKSQHVRLSPITIDAVKEIARKNCVKPSDVYRTAIEFFVSQHSTDSKIMETKMKNERR